LLWSNDIPRVDRRKVRVRAGTLSVDNGPARGRVCELPGPRSAFANYFEQI